MDYKIEKGIPIPKPIIYGFLDTLREMEIGDSFVTDRQAANAHMMAKRAGMKVITRKQDDSTIRVWRVK